MTIEEIRARIAEISAKLKDIKAGEDGLFSDEDAKEVDTLSAEFEKLKKQLDVAEKLETVAAMAADQPGRRTEASAPAATPRISVGDARNAKFGGFENTGQWLMAVKKAGQTGEIDKRLLNYAKEAVGEDGGFLIPEELSSAIRKKLAADDSLMARANVIPVSGNNLSINVDETAPWSGGVRAYWVAEGQTITGSKPQFKQANYRLQKLAALIQPTDELLEDAVALNGYIATAAPNAIMHEINKAIIAGNGVGKPQGIINSPFTVTVGAESGQASDTVVARNIVKMYSRMLPSSRANAVWFIHPQVEEQLRVAKDDSGNFIYLGPGSQMNQTPYSTLLGRPVIPLVGGIPALGDKGDIIFADLSGYTMIQKAGIKSDMSIHLLFDRDISTFRFIMRVDGKSPYQSPVTTENGAYQMSTFVNLEAR